MPTLTIPEIKDEIQRRARERQESLQRGAYDVPLHFSPLPLAKLLDLLSQLEYRHNFLDLAVPPPHPAFGERVRRFFKSLVCRSLRWLLIRQVEFNTVAFQQARAAAELAVLSDQNQGEFVAALTTLRLQIHALAQRIARLEIDQTGSTLSFASDGDGSQETPAGRTAAYQAYLHYLKDQGQILVAGCGHGDFLKLLISEGINAQGVEADAARAEYCKERELPVSCAVTAIYLDQLENGSFGGIYLAAAETRLPPHELGQLFSHCWTKLEKNGVLIAEAANRLGTLQEAQRGQQLPTELLSFLLESQSFTILDCLFSTTANPDAAAIARMSAGLPFDRKDYHHYAVIGRK